MDFPPSPDLNPIEKLWSTMARAVETHQCETVDELQDVIAAEWDKVDKGLMLSWRIACRSVAKRFLMHRDGILSIDFTFMSMYNFC